MNHWTMAGMKPGIFSKYLILLIAVIGVCAAMTTPVFAKDVAHNVLVYENREKTLKITEISFTHDFTSMSVLVENINSKAQFRIEHDLNTADTFNEYIEITATDGMGNISETVHIKNPFYLPEVIEPEPEPIQGSLSVMGGNGNGNETISEPINPIFSEENDSTATDNEPDNEAAEENSGFNTNGWATVVDNASSGSKEFFIVRSETGNEFYIVIDRENGRDNVYFLNAVTEWDLLGLTERYEVPNNLNPDIDLATMTVTQNNNPAPQEPASDNTHQEAPATEEPAENTDAEPIPQGGVGAFGIIMLVLFAGAVGAYFYFFKIRRKNYNTDNSVYLPDDYGDYDDEDEEESSGAAGEDEDDYYDDEAEDTDADYSDPQPQPEAEDSDTPISRHNPVNPDEDIGDSENPDDESAFTDDDVGDDGYGEGDEPDDYGGEIDEEEVLGGLGGDEDDEDNTV